MLPAITNDNVASLSPSGGFYYNLSRTEMIKYIPEETTRVLDVGCGTGGFGGALKAMRQTEVWGIELNPEAASIAANSLEHVFAGSFEEHEAGLPPKYFDCVAFNDVLEHMPDPFTVLSRVSELLKPQGCVVASIPNIRFYRALKHIIVDGDFKYTDFGVFDRTHLRFFTRRSINRMFEDAGFDVLTLEGIRPERRQRALTKCFLAALWTVFPGLRDIRYLQFAVVARPRPAGRP